MESYIAELEGRYNKLLRNGRNQETFGLMRKLRRKINKAKRGIKLA